MIITFPEFTEFSESYAPFRKNSIMNDIFHNVTITYTYFCGFAHFQDSNGVDTTSPACILMHEQENN